MSARRPLHWCARVACALLLGIPPMNGRRNDQRVISNVHTLGAQTQPLQCADAPQAAMDVWLIKNGARRHVGCEQAKQGGLCQNNRVAAATLCPKTCLMCTVQMAQQQQLWMPSLIGIDIVVKERGRVTRA